MHARTHKLTQTQRKEQHKRQQVKWHTPSVSVTRGMLCWKAGMQSFFPCLQVYWHFIKFLSLLITVIWEQVVIRIHLVQ